MRALTVDEMADIEGMKFWAGFGCGAGIIASIAVTGTPDVIARWSIYSGTIAACGAAFF